MVSTLINVSQEFSNPLHVKCIELICHLSRFQANSVLLSSRKDAQECLVACGNSSIGHVRMWTMRAIQNLTTETKGKTNLATPPILTAISASALSNDMEEHLAAVGALLNIATEPGMFFKSTLKGCNESCFSFILYSSKNL